MRFPAFPGRGLYVDLLPASRVLAVVGPAGHPWDVAVLIGSSVCLQICYGTSYHWIAWSRPSGWTLLVGNPCFSPSLSVPLRTALSGVPDLDRLIEMIMALVPDEDGLLALEVMES